MKILRKEKGITLIALVIMVIILAILAGVTMRLAIGNNGVVETSKEAKKEAVEADERTQIETAIKDAKTGSYMDGNDDTLSVEALKKSLDNQFGKDKVDAYVEEVNDESEKKVDEIRIICKDSGNMYSLNKDGTLK
ncbi:MAG: type II secretion system protein [Clostridia bacterium]|nr:type II secretion system protein [Clostridia bacterium]